MLQRMQTIQAWFDLSEGNEDYMIAVSDILDKENYLLYWDNKTQCRNHGSMLLFS